MLLRCASRTSLGENGWKLLAGLDLSLNKGSTSVMVANDRRYESVGSLSLLILARDRVVLVDVIVVPVFLHLLSLSI